jgi:hypothetical protein
MLAGKISSIVTIAARRLARETEDTSLKQKLTMTYARVV